MGKVKKIIAGVLVVAVAGTGITAGLMQLKKNSQKTVSAVIETASMHLNVCRILLALPAP